jgi:hypothetical protein
MYGVPPEAVLDLLVTGGPSAVAARIVELTDLGVERVVFSLTAGSWPRQADLLAEAAALLT